MTGGDEEPLRTARPGSTGQVRSPDSDALVLGRFDGPEAEAYRAEAHGMARAYVNALLAEVSRECVVGIYAKGSAYRAWDSLIDYVPGLSDVDVHVRLRSGHPGAEVLKTLPSALDVAQRALASFGALFPDALHTPRPQLMFLDELESMPGYLPSPVGVAHCLFGEEYEGATRTQYADAASLDVERLLSDADFIETSLPKKVIDRPGVHMWNAVAVVNWRVGPAAPRVLTQLGVDPFHAWSMNRTSLVREFEARGYNAFARAYADYYSAGWDGFRCRFSEAGSASEALLAAHRLFFLAREIIGV